MSRSRKKSSASPNGVTKNGLSARERAVLARRRSIVGVLALLLVAGPLVGVACNRSQKSDEKPKSSLHVVKLGGQEVRVELAADNASRQLGLMYRDELRENHGMLFIFPQPQPQSFYMKNCRMDIDIAYIDDDGVIVETHEMKHYAPGYGGPYEYYRCRTPVRYALEVAGGWLAAHGVKVGDKVEGYRGPPNVTPR